VGDPELATGKDRGTETQAELAGGWPILARHSTVGMVGGVATETLESGMFRLAL
jgi:hypothetical protein